MKTRLRLLLMFVTCAVLFAGTWYFAGPRNRFENPPGPVQAKTTAELLIGTWEIIEQDPPIMHGFKATVEFTTDGKRIVRTRHAQHGVLPPHTGTYQLSGDTIRLEIPEDAENTYQKWDAKLEMLTEDRLVLIHSEGRTRRVVYQRLRGD